MSIVPRLGLLAIAVATALPATTLQQLGLNEMALKSTGIVRGRVKGKYTAAQGSNIYTFYTVDVVETLKGTAAKTVEVAVAGGVRGGIRQMIAGAPVLNPGQDYLLFLWTSKSGLTQVIGMSQGLFNVRIDAAGNLVAMREAADEPIVDAAGRPVEDRPMTMPMTVLRQWVSSALTGAGGSPQGAVQ